MSSKSLENVITATPDKPSDKAHGIRKQMNGVTSKWMEYGCGASGGVMCKATVTE